MKAAGDVGDSEAEEVSPFRDDDDATPAEEIPSVDEDTFAGAWAPEPEPVETAASPDDGKRPALQDLLNAIPASTRAAAEELFRARFVSVKRFRGGRLE